MISPTAAAANNNYKQEKNFDLQSIYNHHHHIKVDNLFSGDTITSYLGGEGFG